MPTNPWSGGAARLHENDERNARVRVDDTKGSATRGVVLALERG